MGACCGMESPRSGPVGVSRCAPMKRSFARFVALLVCFNTLAQSAPDYKRTEDLIYGRKFGTALTLDVFQPEKPNGAAIIFMVSGGFFSSHEAVNGGSYRPFLKRGYTVFAVVHG